MALYLVHRNFNGEPLGVWDKMGRSVYRREEFKSGASKLLETKSVDVPWAAFVDKVERYTNYKEWWSGVESNRTLKSVLDDAYNEYISEEMGR